MHLNRNVSGLFFICSNGTYRRPLTKDALAFRYNNESIMKGKAVLRMKNRMTAETEYGKRKMQICTDTFLNLARVLGESEKTNAGNFREIAEMLKNISEETVRFISLGKKREKQIIRELSHEGILAKELWFVQRGDGQTEFSVILSGRNGFSVTVEDAAGYLSVLMDIRLVSDMKNPFFIGKEPQRYFFREEPGYLFLSGTAKAVKETELISGDNFAFFETAEGNLTAVLSDGMGSGEEACRDSEMVVDMTEGFLETGISPRMAVGLVNSVICHQECESRISTLDLCSIDLYAGRCLFLKSGAAASFIKRGGAVETICAGSLPLGSLGNIQPESAVREVSDGDLIVMVSDGVTESWNVGGEEKIRRYLAETGNISPAELADRLLRHAVEAADGRIRDDMTVLVIGIWERRV